MHSASMVFDLDNESYTRSWMEDFKGDGKADVGAGGALPFDAVVIDLSMPGMGVRRCLAELLSRDPGARVLVASGYSEPTLHRDTLDAGAATFIGKPYRLQELCEILRGVLDGDPPAARNA